VKVVEFYKILQQKYNLILQTSVITSEQDKTHSHLSTAIYEDIIDITETASGYAGIRKVLY